MLGPSGSGKTTTLRLIAGFELPDGGRVELGGADVARRPPFERDVNTVFQDYALFPHMTRARQRRLRPEGAQGLGRGERRARARGGARDGAAARASASASRHSSPAGSASAWRWRARSSTARACCCSTSRSARSTSSCARRCRRELKRIQREVGITFVYVTHDQDEALSMSDRLAVFNEGRIEQVGTPAEVYERPANVFVAGFVGVSNVLERDGRRFTVRPEKIRICRPGERRRRAHRRGGTVLRRRLRRAERPATRSTSTRAAADRHAAEPRDIT